MKVEKFKVISSPWHKLLKGTIVIMTERRKSEKESNGNWYKREDGVNMFKEETTDGSFKLFDSEVEKVN